MVTRTERESRTNYDNPSAHLGEGRARREAGSGEARTGEAAFLGHHLREPAAGGDRLEELVEVQRLAPEARCFPQVDARRRLDVELREALEELRARQVGHRGREPHVADARVGRRNDRGLLRDRAFVVGAGPDIVGAREVRREERRVDAKREPSPLPVVQHATS